MEYKKRINRTKQRIKTFIQCIRTYKQRKKRSPKMVYKKAHQSSAIAESTEIIGPKTEGLSRSFAQKYRNMTQEECVDSILDKINAHGYESLSDEEKDFLANRSKKK